MPRSESATRSSLLDAAEALFAEHGFADTSVRSITESAGANVAAINYHFGSKLGLVKAVLARRVLLEERLLLALLPPEVLAGDVRLDGFRVLREEELRPGQRLGVISLRGEGRDGLELLLQRGGSALAGGDRGGEKEKQRERRQWVRDRFSRRFQATANQFRDLLGEWTSPSEAEKVKHAEAFEICEYGSQPDKEGLARLFPFFE